MAVLKPLDDGRSSLLLAFGDGHFEYQGKVRLPGAALKAL